MARDGGERLVQQGHSLDRAIRVHQGRTEVGQRHELQIGVTGVPGPLERLPEELHLAGPVALEHADVQGHPSGLRRAGRVAEQGLRPGEPSPAHGPVAQDHQVHARHRSGHADRADVFAGLPMGCVRAFPFLDAPDEVELQVGGLRQPLEHRARRGIRAGTLEEASGARRITDAQRGATLGEHVVDRGGHGRDRPTVSATAAEDRRRFQRADPARALAVRQVTSLARSMRRIMR